MLSKLTLDKLIPLPTEEELLQQLTKELLDEGFPITNLQPKGVFYILLRVFVRIKVELLGLARSMLSNLYITSADSVDWLETRGVDFCKFRKPALKTEGRLTLTRSDVSTTQRIRQGCIFKTEPGASGDELRYLSTSEVVFPAGTGVCTVPVEAEIAGISHNVPAGKITRCLLHLESVTGITNAADWITREGTDIETIDSLRARLINVWAELSMLPTRDKYKSVCEKVPVVLYVNVNDQHPRGQGTVDIIVTSSTGSASETLLTDVETAAREIAGPYDNLLVKPSETVTQDVVLSITLPMQLSDDGIAARAEETVRGLFTISRDRVLNELYLSDLVVAVKAEIPTAKGVRVVTPTADVILSNDKVIVLGTVTVQIERA